MNTILVIYKSKYGTVKKYAEWIAADLGADIYAASKVSLSIMKKYQVIVFCGGLYSGKINGINIVVKNMEKIKDKKIIICTCGLSDPDNADNIRQIEERVHTVLPPAVRVFHLAGAINHGKLNFTDGLLMKIMRKVFNSRSPDTLNDEEKKLLALSTGDVDFISRENIKPAVDYCKSL